MSRLGVPSSSTLSHRGGGSAATYSNDTAGSPFASRNSAPSSGRSSPYPPPQNGSAYGAQRVAEDLEEQNDERLEGLTAKVKLLKDITIGIGNEVRDSTVQLSQMNDAFAETGGILGGTFRRMNAMAQRQGSRWMCYMIFIIMVAWFFVFVWWFRR